MDIKTYARRYRNSRVSEVEKYLAQGRIRGAVIENGVWNVPNADKVEYRPKKKRPTVEDDIIDILKALHGNWYVDAETLCLSEPDFADRVNLLKQAGLIKDSQKPCDGVTSTGLTLTSEGLQVASNKKQVILELWQKLFAGISEGAIRAMS